MTVKIGLIAEDKSDVDVFTEVVRKVRPGVRYGLKTFLGHGWGKIRSKCLRWASILNQQGCRCLVLLHDLDTSNLNSLRALLQATMAGCPIAPFVIVIPIREIEAWLLTDSSAIRETFGIKLHVKEIANPERVGDPKRALADIVYRLSHKRRRYLNTTDNSKLAAKTRLTMFRRCNSFKPLEAFLLHVVR